MGKDNAGWSGILAGLRIVYHGDECLDEYQRCTQ
jgi:hypothetical protein